MSDKPSEKVEEKDKKQPDNGRRNFLKYAGAGVVGFAAASVIEYPYLNGQVTSLQEEVTTLNGQVSNLNSQVSSDQQQISGLESQLAMNEAFITLGINEAKLLEAMVETIIPSETGNPGAKEAGVIYFIDRQLATDYGKNGNMYMTGPFVAPGQSGPVTVDGITYSEGVPAVPWPAGQRYQYPMLLRDFWRSALDSTQAYSNSAYGHNFEDLTDAQKTQVLTDLYNNRARADFNGILPFDFFSELIFMTYSGFLMDPMYGGNRNLVGWKLTGFNGPNMGDFYGEGYQPTQLMVSDKPIRLQPASLGQYQQKQGLSQG